MRPLIDLANGGQSPEGKRFTDGQRTSIDISARNRRGAGERIAGLTPIPAMAGSIFNGCGCIRVSPN